MSLDSQLGNHPAFPCWAPALCQVSALPYPSILYPESDQLGHPEQEEGRGQLALGMNSPWEVARGTQQEQGGLGAVPGTGAKGCHLQLT